MNGNPLAVIECKTPHEKDALDQAVSQHEDEIPKLFLYAQLLLSVTKNEAKYATVGTQAKSWAITGRRKRRRRK